MRNYLQLNNNLNRFLFPDYPDYSMYYSAHVKYENDENEEKYQIPEESRPEDLNRQSSYNNYNDRVSDHY